MGHGIESPVYFQLSYGNDNYSRTDFILVEGDMNLSITK